MFLFPFLQTSVVNYIDQRTKPRSDQLFFVVFEWKDPFIQTVQDVSNTNPFSNQSACTSSWFVCVCKPITALLAEIQRKSEVTSEISV